MKAARDWPVDDDEAQGSSGLATPDVDRSSNEWHGSHNMGKRTVANIRPRRIRTMPKATMAVPAAPGPAGGACGGWRDRSARKTLAAIAAAGKATKMNWPVNGWMKNNAHSAQNTNS